MIRLIASDMDGTLLDDSSRIPPENIAAIRELIAHKKDKLVGDMAAQGTTPRRLTDLIGSLCDLTSGSGDKGTPVVLVQNYFDNYAK